MSGDPRLATYRVASDAYWELAARAARLEREAVEEGRAREVAPRVAELRAAAEASWATARAIRGDVPFEGEGKLWTPMPDGTVRDVATLAEAELRTSHARSMGLA